MKISRTCYLLLTAGIYATEALHTTTEKSNEEGNTLMPKDIRNGWINPEDLAPMPQCIAQQDRSAWLSTMTACTGKQCTRHFGVFCTHHQWLTQLSCLSSGFSPTVVQGYFPYCAKSVLAKAQLYLWIRTITGRTWLVDAGDTNGLQNLSPSSLAKGYAAVDVTHKAPTCLTGSVSGVSIEPFRQVMASCSFGSISQHTGNAARPWEYRESIQSMVALEFQTAGYDLTGIRIPYGNYFDKECFCSAFIIDLEKEPCSAPESGQLDLTKERLWLNATCGPTSLPNDWTEILKTTEFGYIPIEDWHWPMCVADMSEQVIELPAQCQTYACEIDSSGYCKVVRAIDRACFCRDISYDSCGGSCHIFSTRIDYIKWLHDLCGNVQDWHGLPDNWRQLTTPTLLEMIPWRWTLRPSNDSNITSITRSGSTRAAETCASTEWKFGSFALVNVATFLAVFLSQRKGKRRDAHPCGWIFKGTLIAALQLLANSFNASLVQNTPGYENVDFVQLMLLWCSIPRLVWLPALLIVVQPSEAINTPAVASSLFAEMILQLLSSYYMAMTVNYGWKHDFYFEGLEGAERGGLAKVMYVGALMWFIIIGPAFGQLTWAIRRLNKIGSSEETPLMSSEGGDYAVYGTFSIKVQKNWVQKIHVEMYAATVIAVLLLWIAQWFFWGGFIGLSLDEFCPPKLGVLTAVWTASSLAGVAVGAM